jgi:hypothetical protein
MNDPDHGRGNPFIIFLPSWIYDGEKLSQFFEQEKISMKHCGDNSGSALIGAISPRLESQTKIITSIQNFRAFSPSIY